MEYDAHSQGHLLHKDEVFVENMGFKVGWNHYVQLHENLTVIKKTTRSTYIVLNRVNQSGDWMGLCFRKKVNLIQSLEGIRVPDVDKLLIPGHKGSVGHQKITKSWKTYLLLGFQRTPFISWVSWPLYVDQNLSPKVSRLCFLYNSRTSISLIMY